MRNGYRVCGRQEPRIVAGQSQAGLPLPQEVGARQVQRIERPHGIGKGLECPEKHGRHQFEERDSTDQRASRIAVAVT